MFVVRPVELADVDALEHLAAVMTPGVHTLPRTRDTIAAFVERSIASFGAQVDIPSEESYLFVLEDSASGEVVGTAAVHASAGSNGTYFAFRNDVIQQVSRDLNISHSVHALTLCSELTACSQLAGFHLRDREHAGIEAALLSRARLLYAVLAPHRFGDRFFVPLAGVTDAGRRVAVLECAGPQILQDGFPRRRARHRRFAQPHHDRRADAALSGLRAAAAGRRPGGDGTDPPERPAGLRPAHGRGLRSGRICRHLRRRPDPGGPQDCRCARSPARSSAASTLLPMPCPRTSSPMRWRRMPSASAPLPWPVRLATPPTPCCCPWRRSRRWA